jgi:hypothetical protein
MEAVLAGFSAAILVGLIGILTAMKSGFKEIIKGLQSIHAPLSKTRPETAARRSA